MKRGKHICTGTLSQFLRSRSPHRALLGPRVHPPGNRCRVLRLIPKVRVHPARIAARKEREAAGGPGASRAQVFWTECPLLNSYVTPRGVSPRRKGLYGVIRVK